MKLVIELRGPPVGKGRGRAVSIPGIGARVYSDPKTVKYETQLRHAGTQAMIGKELIEGPFQVLMIVRFPVPTTWSKKKTSAALAGLILPTVRPDGDNILKLQDALNLVCFRDDKQAVDSRVVKIYSDRPGLTIYIDTDLPDVSAWIDRPASVSSLGIPQSAEALPLFTT